jgi:hypothetical protein
MVVGRRSVVLYSRHVSSCLCLTCKAKPSTRDMNMHALSTFPVVRVFSVKYRLKVCAQILPKI